MTELYSEAQLIGEANARAWCVKHNAYEKVTCCEHMGWCERWDGVLNADQSSSCVWGER
jgi:hypothetical protein